MSIEALSQRTLQHLETIKSLRDSFTVSTRAEEFLYTHSGLLAVLKEAKQQILKYFGDTPLELDVAENERGESYKLYLKIPVTTSVEEANKNLNALDENWTLSHMDELEHVIIDVAYV